MSRPLPLRLGASALFFFALISAAGMASGQTKFVVLIGSNIGGGLHSGCNQQILNYVATHPNRTGANTLTFSTYQAALQAAKDTPCGGFNRLRIVGSEKASSYYLPGEVDFRYAESTYVDHLRPPDPPIANPEMAHMYYYWPNETFVPGDYDDRVFNACGDWCAKAEATRLGVTHEGQDRWLCKCKRVVSGVVVYPETKLYPYCPYPLFQYVPGDGSPKSGSCRWYGQVDIWSVNNDIGKPPNDACGPNFAGNPIDVARGAKIQTERDYVDPRGLLDITRTYASVVRSDFTGWWFNFQSKALLNRPGHPSIPVQSISFIKDDQQTLTYTRSTRTAPWTLTGDADNSDSFFVDSLDAPTDVRLKDQRRGEVRYHDNLGRMRQRVFQDGRSITYSYIQDPATLQLGQIRLTDQFARSVTAFVDPWKQTISQILLPDGSTLRYEHDAVLRPMAVGYQDGSKRLYHYDEPGQVIGSQPFALSGISEESPAGTVNRIATFSYDGEGRATSTQRANGINRYQITYVTPHQQTIVQDPLGTPRVMTFAAPVGVLKNVSLSQPAGAGCGPAAALSGYDANGNLTASTDFNGSKTCYAYDLSRNLETNRAEGLSSSADCTSALSSPPAGTRLISTQWHPDWRLETRIAEPKKLTTIVYNGQGVTCAPDTVLVDGKPPAVVCSRTEQATTDETGAAGFAATVTGTARTWSYTYTTYGRVLTATDPNGAVTSYSYHPDNDANLGRRGNVASITNALGHVTRITAYNAHGQPTRIIDPNNLVTDLTYDLRMRLTRRKVGNESTSFVYDPAGQLTRVTLPDGARLTYTYDAAQRLTAIQDHKGNKVAYTLDTVGNRINEKLTDPGGVLVRNIQRSIDALNRVQQVTGAGH